MKIQSVLALALAAATFAIAPTIVVAGGYYGAKNTAAMAAKSDIVDTAVGAGQFNTLAKALTAAGLIDTLKGPARSPSSRRPTRPSPRFRPTSSTPCSPTKRR